MGASLALAGVAAMAILYGVSFGRLRFVPVRVRAWRGDQRRREGAGARDRLM